MGIALYGKTTSVDGEFDVSAKVGRTNETISTLKNAEISTDPNSVIAEARKELESVRPRLNPITLEVKVNGAWDELEKSKVNGTKYCLNDPEPSEIYTMFDAKVRQEIINEILKADIDLSGNSLKK